MKHVAAILFAFVLCSTSAFAQQQGQLPTFPPGYDQSDGPVNQILQAYNQEKYLEALVAAKLARALLFLRAGHLLHDFVHDIHNLRFTLFFQPPQKCISRDTNRPPHPYAGEVFLVS